MYPDSAEREYERITNAYMRLLNEELKESLPEILEAYKRYQHGDSRFDDIRDLEEIVRKKKWRRWFTAASVNIGTGRRRIANCTRISVILAV